MDSCIDCVRSGHPCREHEIEALERDLAEHKERLDGWIASAADEQERRKAAESALAEEVRNRIAVEAVNAALTTTLMDRVEAAERDRDMYHAMRDVVVRAAKEAESALAALRVAAGKYLEAEISAPDEAAYEAARRAVSDLLPFDALLPAPAPAAPAESPVDALLARLRAATPEGVTLDEGPTGEDGWAYLRWRCGDVSLDVWLDLSVGRLWDPETGETTDESALLAAVASLAESPAAPCPETPMPFEGDTMSHEDSPLICPECDHQQGGHFLNCTRCSGGAA